MTTRRSATHALPAAWMAWDRERRSDHHRRHPGETLTGQDFGLWHGSRLSGRVFRDDGTGSGTANDGVQNGGEVGLTGVTVQVTDDSATTIAATQTDPDGAYTVWVPFAVGAVPLSVRELNPAGHDSVGGASGDTGGVYTRTTDTTRFTHVPGTLYDGVNFADVPANTLVPNGQQPAAPGAVVLYPHVFTAGTAGTVTFSIAQLDAPDVPGWEPVLLYDANANGILEAGETPVSGGFTLAAASRCISSSGRVPCRTGWRPGPRHSLRLSPTPTRPPLEATYRRPI